MSLTLCGCCRTEWSWEIHKRASQLLESYNLGFLMTPGHCSETERLYSTYLQRNFGVEPVSGMLSIQACQHVAATSDMLRLTLNITL